MWSIFIFFNGVLWSFYELLADVIWKKRCMKILLKKESISICVAWEKWQHAGLETTWFCFCINDFYNKTLESSGHWGTTTTHIPTDKPLHTVCLSVGLSFDGDTLRITGRLSSFAPLHLQRGAVFRVFVCECAFSGHE